MGSTNPVSIYMFLILYLCLYIKSITLESNNVIHIQNNTLKYDNLFFLNLQWTFNENSFGQQLNEMKRTAAYCHPQSKTDGAIFTHLIRQEMPTKVSVEGKAISGEHLELSSFYHHFYSILLFFPFYSGM